MSREMLRQKEGFPSNVFEIIPEGVSGQVITESPSGPGFEDSGIGDISDIGFSGDLKDTLNNPTIQIEDQIFIKKSGEWVAQIISSDELQNSSNVDGGAGVITDALNTLFTSILALGNDKEDKFSKNTAFNKNFGSSFGTVTEGNDPRLSNPRTPNPHAASHVNGADDIQSATASQKGLATPTQITKLNGIAPLAQVNTLNDGDYNEDDTESTTVSTTFVNKLSHILNVAVAGDYFIQWHFALANSNVDKVSEVQVTLEGTQIGVCETSAKPANLYSCVSGFKRSSLAVGAHTINIDYRAVNNTAKIKAARLQIFKMP